MKRYLFILIIIPFLTSCGAGGGGGVVNNPGGGDDGTSNKPNTACSGSSHIAKIKIKEDGIYRITYSALCSAGINLSGTDITTLKVTNQKDEVAIDVVDSNGNGVFDDGDYAEFYGKALARDDSRFRFTETNVYWLSAGEEAGMRMEGMPGDSNALTGPASFLKVLHMEEDTWYEQKNYPEVTSFAETREHWFWGEVFYTPGVAGTDTSLYRRSYNFSTRYIDRTQPVYLSIRLQSVSGSHHVKGYINNKLVVDQYDPAWNEQEPYEIFVNVPAGDLINGPNVLTLESAGGTASGIYEIFYLDWFEVQYYHTYQAEHDALEFTGSGLITLSNFTTNDISIYEISDPNNVKKFKSLRESTSFSSTGNKEGRFLALASSQKKSPFAVEPYIPAHLRSKNADYIIITHKNFYEAIKVLADYRTTGFNVLIADVADVYDEFSEGIETPQSIKEFLTYAYKNWAAKPRYILLVGDSTIDFKDMSGYGSTYGVKSYVPAYLYNYPGLGEVPTDNWFVDVEGDVLPEMYIGRIPSKSPSDVTTVVNKIISHETSSYRSDNILLVADDDISIFEELSNSIAGIIPDGYNISKLYQGEYPDDLRAKIIAAINSSNSPLVLNYTGHGSVVNWTKEGVFSSKDIGDLNNKGGYPFVVALNCLNGYFVLPDDGVAGQDGLKQDPSIAEAFLLSQEKGAVAVWAASAIGYPSEHDPLAKALYNRIFNEDVTVLGDAVTEAKKRAYSNNDIMDDVVQTFIFFGDPATRLK